MNKPLVFRVPDGVLIELYVSGCRIPQHCLRFQDESEARVFLNLALRQLDVIKEDKELVNRANIWDVRNLPMGQKVRMDNGTERGLVGKVTRVSATSIEVQTPQQGVLEFDSNGFETIERIDGHIRILEVLKDEGQEKANENG